MKIRDLLEKSGILIDLQAADRGEAIARLAGHMALIYNLKDSGLIFRKVMEREVEVSTGIGFGIAVPHGRLEKIDRVYMVAGRSAKGIDFSAIDGQSVYLIFLVISPPGTSNDHVLVLSSLSRIMSYEDMRKKLLSARRPDLFLDHLIRGERKYVEQ